MVATLVFGLRDNSRLKMKLSGMDYSIDTLLKAIMCDQLALLVYSKQKKGKKPESIYLALTKSNKEDDSIVTFASAEDFERAKREILESKEG